MRTGNRGRVWALAALLAAPALLALAPGGAGEVRGEGGVAAAPASPTPSADAAEEGYRPPPYHRPDPEDPFPPRTIGAEAMRQGCVDCHAKTEPGLVAGFHASRHAAKGVSCADCHGLDHTTIFSQLGRVSAGTCARCHEREVTEFETSAHARAEAVLAGDARFAAVSEAERAACVQCHSIGARDPTDGSLGRCSSCHAGHEFRAAAAREPEACAGCHRGPDHPQAEAYFASKHGIAWAATRDPSRAPTCATCHMPRGAHGRDAIVSIGGVRHGARVEGDARQPAPPYAMPAITTASAVAAREAAIAGCAQCHARRVATDALARADEVKREADRRLDRAARAIAAARAAQGAPAPVLGPAQVADRGGALERRFHQGFAREAPTAWKGAYHLSAAHVFAEGLEPLGVTCREIEAEASEASTKGRAGVER